MQTVQRVVSKALRVAQSAACVGHALHIAVVIGRSVVVAEIQHRRGRAARAQLDLIRLQAIVVSDRVNQAVAVGFSAQRIVRSIADTGNTGARRITRRVAVQKAQPSRPVIAIGDRAAIARAGHGRIRLAGYGARDTVARLDQVVN